MTTLIEGMIGQDRGSNAGNNWDKFVIKGIELVAEEHIRSRREDYTKGALEAEDGVVFTIWDDADWGTPRFYIAIVDSSAETMRIDGYSHCFLSGKFRILCEAKGDTYAKRLLKWWIDGTAKKAQESQQLKEQGKKGTYTRSWQKRFAEHLAVQITRRGVKDPAPMEESDVSSAG